MTEFGFIMAVTLGATAATTDLTDGMFRHLVITGRSRVAARTALVSTMGAVRLTATACWIAPGTSVPGAPTGSTSRRSWRSCRRVPGRFASSKVVWKSPTIAERV